MIQMSLFSFCFLDLKKLFRNLLGSCRQINSAQYLLMKSISFSRKAHRKIHNSSSSRTCLVIGALGKLIFVQIARVLSKGPSVLVGTNFSAHGTVAMPTESITNRNKNDNNRYRVFYLMHLSPFPITLSTTESVARPLFPLPVF